MAGLANLAERPERQDLPIIRIAVVFRKQRLDTIKATDMAVIRWLRMSQALARAGFEVDVVVDAPNGAAQKSQNLRYVTNARVRWEDYDVVKTLFHSGFDALCSYGGDAHPFIISKLGSVVGHRDDVDGVHFFGRERRELFETQLKISERSAYVTVLTQPSRDLWVREHGGGDRSLFVPTGVDRVLPDPGPNPYRGFDEKIAVYIGNLYRDRQAEVNRLWQSKLNALGHRLKARGVRLCVIGDGDAGLLDSRCVTYLGAVDHARIWDYHYFAHVGIVLAQGDVQHNESSKIYYYLRAGLPVVSERPVPNNHLIETTGFGYVSEFGDTVMMSDMIARTALRTWDSADTVQYMLDHHTWDARASYYRRLIRRDLSRAESTSLSLPA